MSLVTRRVHPDNPRLEILNYTPEAQYSGALKVDPYLRRCRGLILLDGEEHRAGFPKFFNLGEQPEEDALYAGYPFDIEEKLDGSLGILYHDGEDWAIATRGSFVSEQALAATEILRTKYRAWLDGLAPDAAAQFEIILPENRIVVDYGDQRDLVLLDGGAGWPGPVKRTFGSGADPEAVREALAHVGGEGFVLVWADGRRVKVKFEEYVRLHRIVTGANERAIWETLAAGTWEAYRAALPDELYSWADEVAGGLLAQKEALLDAARAAFASAPRTSRRDFALAVKDLPVASLVFGLLDGKDVEAMAWTLVRP